MEHALDTGCRSNALGRAAEREHASSHVASRNLTPAEMALARHLAVHVSRLLTGRSPTFVIRLLDTPTPSRLRLTFSGLFTPSLVRRPDADPR